MNCAPLPNTGLDANIGPLLLLAIACLIAGTTTTLLARRRGRATSAPLVLLLLLGTMSTLITITIGIEAPAQAATSECSSSDDRLIVTQTSTMEGLAPGVAPVPITGRLMNDSEDSTHITAVDVEITSITSRPGASAGGCGVGDYLLNAARMRVGRTIGPGGSTHFAGASIGFNNTTHNQDACQGATIHLLYTANPS